MVHPLLLLEYFHNLLRPLLFPHAVTEEAIKNANSSIDAITYTWLIIMLLLVLSVLATSALKSIPGKLQNFMEVVVGGIENMIVETMGEHGRPFFPLIATLAIFVLVSNLMGLIPGFFPPTANINTTA
ncbi:MAG: F0F1 ATP synthase subunit A, partial [Verrucomicrobia bacterium]|nr:F0F1 ATP synthase subunit A [Deltaproteobacteria bacterium]